MIVRICGDPEAFSLEHRLFNLMLLLAVLMALWGAVYDLSLHLPAYTIYPLFLAASVGMVTYYFSRIRRMYSEILIYPMVVVCTAVGLAFFFLNSGSSGPMFMLLLSVYQIFIILTNGRHQYYLLSLLLVSGGVALWMELRFPEWVVPYTGAVSRFADTSITFLFSALFMASATVLFKRNYNQERQTLAMRNRELNQLNETIREQKVMLEQKTGHLEKALHEVQEKNHTIQTLMKELNHRVGNNLQLIYSLLNLQEAEITDPLARQSLTQAKNRIIAISLLHQKLYRNDQSLYIDLPGYIRELSGYLIQDVMPRVELEYTFKPPVFQTDLKTSIHIGLIINELVTNALKHAWPIRNQDRQLKLTCSYDRNRKLTLNVSDNGIGFDPVIAQQKDSRFGLRFVQSVLDQYAGKMTLRGRDGGSVELFMNLPEIPEVIPYA